MIELRDIGFVYDINTSEETVALKNVNFKINKGEFIAIIGHTGSGKSTLLHLFNGLEIATSGVIFYNGENIYQKGYDLNKLRQKIGIVFQYPEDQLFELEVLSDVYFGLKNYGFSLEYCIEKAKEVLKIVGVEEKYYHLSPFELSGGLKRRVALAGILAMEPEILILDELEVGLDARGKTEIFDLIEKISNEKGTTVIMASHSMEDVARYARRVIVMNHGTVQYDDIPKNVFKNLSELEAIGLSVPKVNYIVSRLKKCGLNVDESAITIDEAISTIIQAVRVFDA